MPLRHSHARFRMGPRLREDDKKKTKETGRQEMVRERVECFVVSRKLATRQTRTALKLVTITEPHSPSPSFSRTREPIHPRTPRVSLAKVLTTTNIPMLREQGELSLLRAKGARVSSFRWNLRSDNKHYPKFRFIADRWAFKTKGRFKSG